MGHQLPRVAHLPVTQDVTGVSQGGLDGGGAGLVDANMKEH